jgi:MFS family permease
MAVIWAIAQLPMIASVDFAILLGCRILLGAGEGPAFPTAVHALYGWFPDEHRSVPTVILLMGVTAALIAAPALTYVITLLSWHWAFGILGAAGIVWSLAWLAFGRDGDIARLAPSYASFGHTRIGYRRLLSCGTTIGVIACGFSAYSGMALLLVWFPSYLVDGLDFAAEQAGWLMALPPVGLAAVQLIVAYLSERAVLAGASTRTGRALPGALGTALGGIALCLVPLCQSSTIKVELLILGVSLPSTIYVLAYPMLSEFIPARQRGAVLATVNSIITLAGITAPYLMGRFVGFGTSPLAGYEKGFLYCGVATIIGGLIGVFALHPDTEFVRLGRSAKAPIGSRVPMMRRSS